MLTKISAVLAVLLMVISQAAVARAGVELFGFSALFVTFPINVIAGWTTGRIASAAWLWESGALEDLEFLQSQWENDNGR